METKINSDTFETKVSKLIKKGELLASSAINSIDTNLASLQNLEDKVNLMKLKNK